MPGETFFRCAGFRTVGNAATTQNLLTVGLPATSAWTCVIERVYLTMDATAVLIAVAPSAVLARTTAVPSAGTVLTPAPDDPNMPVPTALEIRGATASDGGAATAITATSSTVIARQSMHRLHTAVGQVIGTVIELLPLRRPIVLVPGAGLLLSISAAAGTSNPATNHYYPVVQGYLARRLPRGTQ